MYTCVLCMYIYIYIYVYKHMYIYIYIYICKTYRFDFLAVRPHRDAAERII